MYIFRPVTVADLPAVEALAAQSPVGVTSLPANREALLHKIQASLDALATEVRLYGEERYFFTVEDRASGRLLGLSGLVASAGYNEPFYSFRNELLIHASPELGIHNKIHALSLCHDLTGHSLLTSFFILPELGAGPAAELLSRSRLLFMAGHPARFADTVVSEMLGVTREDGSSPFWDAVGRVFFGLDYHEAELICGVKGRKFIAELMRQHPIYVPLLSAEAQAVIGEVGEGSRIAFDILEREGFETENYLDIFDGGPTLLGRLPGLRSYAGSRVCRVRLGPVQGGGPYLLANGGLSDFCATLARLHPPAHGEVTVPPDVAAALGVAEGEMVRLAAL